MPNPFSIKHTGLLGLLALGCLLMPPARSAIAASTSSDPIPPMARKVKGFDLRLLEPVQGVTFRQIGQASYYFGFVPTLTKAQVLAEVGADPANYDAADKVFTQRMTDDKTFVLISLFGAYSDEAAQGRFAAYAHDVAQSVLAGSAPLREPLPMSEDKFREIQSFYGRKEGTTGDRPADLDLILVPYGLTYNDYQILSTWFGRRFGLEGGPEAGLPQGSDIPDVKPDPPRTDLGGLWQIWWTVLKRGDKEMEIVRQSREVCFKADMNAATLPLMPKRGNAKCVLQPFEFSRYGINVSAQCDQGDFGSHWMLSLQPASMVADPPNVGHPKPAPKQPGDDAPYKGEIEFGMETEGAAQAVEPGASTPVTANRIGDCK